MARGRSLAPRTGAPSPGMSGRRRVRALRDVALTRRLLQRRALAPMFLGLGLAKLANFCKFLAGSFSAVSKRNFARKYAFDSIFQALQDFRTFATLQSQTF